MVLAVGLPLWQHQTLHFKKAWTASSTVVIFCIRPKPATIINVAELGPIFQLTSHVTLLLERDPIE